MHTVRSRDALPGRDILNAPEQTVLITINVVGAMGRGVALSLRERHPAIYQHYRKRCKAGLVLPNSLMSYRVSTERRILLFPTKIDWRDPSPPELIIDNLHKLANHYPTLKITSLALPPLGQLNGRLAGEDKTRVRQAIHDVLSDIPLDSVLYQDE
jgi:hypothetical protein